MTTTATTGLAHTPATLRKLRDLSQETLARLAKVGLRTLREIEAGRPDTRLSTLRAIAAQLGVPLIDYVAAVEHVRERKGAA